MYRLLLITTLLVATVAVGMAHAPGASFGWEATTHSFGRIPQGKPAVAEFRFVNRGGVPLLIASAKGSCGCTGVDYPQTPILPGQSGLIRATFNAAALGAFNKSVFVESNAEGGSETLYVKGKVVNPDTKL